MQLYSAGKMFKLLVKWFWYLLAQQISCATELRMKKKFYNLRPVSLAKLWNMFMQKCSKPQNAIHIMQSIDGMRLGYLANANSCLLEKNMIRLWNTNMPPVKGKVTGHLFFFCMNGKPLSQGTYMSNMKALSERIQNLWPMLKLSNKQTNKPTNRQGKNNMSPLLLPGT